METEQADLKQLKGENSMNIMWITPFYQMEDEESNTVSGPLKMALADAYPDSVKLTIVSQPAAGNREKTVRENVTYVPVDEPFDRIGIGPKEWEKMKAKLLRLIEDAKPDVIQCFGVEWPFGGIQEYTTVPVVIHLMGFLNIYHPTLQLVTGRNGNGRHRIISILSAAADRCRRILIPREDTNPEEMANTFERRSMSMNRYFIGRTQWDRNIVKYYAPNAVYFHAAEAIKPTIYRSAGTWQYRRKEKLRLLTISSGDDRKGNEIILRCAALLSDLIGLDFEWHVAGHREFFPKFEEHTGIHREDVHVKLIGIIDAQQIVRELQDADFFIHPSVIDNSPNSVCEAQIVGCPVIASNVGGLPQLIDDGVTGFLYPYNEPHTLAFLIGNLYRDAELLKRVSEQESRVSVKRHDPEKIAETMIEIYNTVIGDNGNDGKKAK